MRTAVVIVFCAVFAVAAADLVIPAGTLLIGAEHETIAHRAPAPTAAPAHHKELKLAPYPPKVPAPVYGPPAKMHHTTPKPVHHTTPKPVPTVPAHVYGPPVHHATPKSVHHTTPKPVPTVPAHVYGPPVHHTTQKPRTTPKHVPTVPAKVYGPPPVVHKTVLPVPKLPPKPVVPVVKPYVHKVTYPAKLVTVKPVVAPYPAKVVTTHAPPTTKVVYKPYPAKVVYKPYPTKVVVTTPKSAPYPAKTVTTHAPLTTKVVYKPYPTKAVVTTHKPAPYPAKVVVTTHKPAPYPAKVVVTTPKLAPYPPKAAVPAAAYGPPAHYKYPVRSLLIPGPATPAEEPVIDIVIDSEKVLGAPHTPINTGRQYYPADTTGLRSPTPLKFHL